MRFLPYGELGDAPNIIVDGAAGPNTSIVLSHWPRSGTPASLKADLSAEIVFRYLERPEMHVSAGAVSNNHFDEDGLIGVWTLLHPDEAAARRELLVDVASAGDFGWCRTRPAARTAFTLASFADPATSPLDAAIFSRPYPRLAAGLYEELLPRLAGILDAPERFREHWEEEDASLEAGERAIRSGAVTIEEDPALDLAIVRLSAPCHSMAIHNATRRYRILRILGGRYEVQYRYESWVQLISSRPAPRVDLSPLARDLSAEESGGARWEFEGADEMTPRLRLVPEDRESTLAPESFIARLRSFLSSAPPAWDPYDA